MQIPGEGREDCREVHQQTPYARGRGNTDGGEDHQRGQQAQRVREERKQTRWSQRDQGSWLCWAWWVLVRTLVLTQSKIEGPWRAGDEVPHDPTSS